MQNFLLQKFFGSPPSDLKSFSPPPFFAMKIMGQPAHKKACKLNVYWKICGNFFSKAPYKDHKF